MPLLLTDYLLGFVPNMMPRLAYLMIFANKVVIIVTDRAILTAKQPWITIETAELPIPDLPIHYNINVFERF